MSFKKNKDSFIIEKNIIKQGGIMKYSPFKLNEKGDYFSLIENKRYEKVKDIDINNLLDIPLNNILNYKISTRNKIENLKELKELKIIQEINEDILNKQKNLKGDGIFYKIKKDKVKKFLGKSDNLFLLLNIIKNKIKTDNILQYTYFYHNQLGPDYKTLLNNVLYDNKKIENYLKYRKMAKKNTFYFLYKKGLFYTTLLYIYNKYYINDENYKEIFKIILGNKAKEFKDEYLKDKKTYQKYKEEILNRFWDDEDCVFFLLLVFISVF